MAPVANGESASVVLLLVLLLGSLTAGILFATPLGRRYRSAAPTGSRSVNRPAWRSAASAVRQRWATLYPLLVGPEPGHAQEAPKSNQPPARPVAAADAAADPQPAASRRAPWSTGPALDDERYRPTR